MKNGILTPTARKGVSVRATAKKDEGKVPKNLSLTQDVIDQGNTLAKEDKRDFSAEVSWLIESEVARRSAV